MLTLVNMIDYRIQLFIDICIICVGLKYSTKLLIPNTKHSLFLFYIFCYIMTFNYILALNILTYIIASEVILIL